MISLIINVRSAASTRRAGEALGKTLVSGDVLLLSGPLGAGKTTFTQGLARGLDIGDTVMSPTFVLMRELKGRLPLYHLDLYRLENLPEICDLGLDDYFYGQGVTVVEWADRAAGLMPEEHLQIELEYTGERSRRLYFKAYGEHYEQLLDKLAARSEVKA